MKDWKVNIPKVNVLLPTLSLFDGVCFSRVDNNDISVPVYEALAARHSIGTLRNHTFVGNHTNSTPRTSKIRRSHSSKIKRKVVKSKAAVS